MDVPSFGMPAQALAILMIVFGVLILVLPALLPFLVSILLIVMGVMLLVGSGSFGRSSTGRTRYRI